MLGCIKTRSAFTIFHFWYQKMIFCFLFFYGSCPGPRSRTNRSERTQTNIICCCWLLQTTYSMEVMKAGSTGTPVQLTPLSPIIIFKDLDSCSSSQAFSLVIDFIGRFFSSFHLLFHYQEVLKLFETCNLQGIV